MLLEVVLGILATWRIAAWLWSDDGAQGVRSEYDVETEGKTRRVVAVAFPGVGVAAVVVEVVCVWLQLDGAAVILVGVIPVNL